MKRIYDDDPSILDDLKEKRRALATAEISGDAAGREITSGGGNGMTFTALVTLTKRDQATYIDYAIRYIEGDVGAHGRSYARFQ